MNNQPVSFRLWILLIATCLFFPSVCPAEDNIKKKWRQLLDRDAFVYTVPAVVEESPLDGTYVKKIEKKGDRVPCRRCPDWLPNPGIWKLNLNKGTYRIINTATGWKSIGTYILAGNRILFANDPSCIHGIGVYAWELKEGTLTFELIDDPCAIKLRARNLVEKVWRSCMPPNIEAAVTEHWNRPKGCE